MSCDVIKIVVTPLVPVKVIRVAPPDPIKVIRVGTSINYYTSEGDMAKSVYDINNNGVVDDAERLAGYVPNNLPISGGYF